MMESVNHLSGPSADDALEQPGRALYGVAVAGMLSLPLWCLILTLF